MKNPILLMDGYKLDHRRQYPKGTEYVYSNWTARQSRVEGQKDVVFFGMQYFLQRYMMDEFNENFFGRPIDDIVRHYERRVSGYIGPNTIGTSHIEDLHSLGYLPLEFRSIPEGTRVPLRIPMLTVENTDDDFFWLPNYFETLMSSVLWLPCTSATTSLRYRKLLDRAAKETGSPADFVQWQGHDFSMRGMEGPEAGALSGAGHLLYFTGTDTIPAIDLIEEYYGPVTSLIGGSVAATEHSVMCAGEKDGETETYRRIICDVYPEGIVSIVSDTWDFWHVLTNIIPQLKEQILARNGKVVIRPDSGDPVKIVCGDSDAPIGSPAYKGAVEILWEIFGGVTTSTGHRLLDQHIGVIYGDSITEERAYLITKNLAAKGFASGNVVFGIGSYTFQLVTRDTYGFAMKATWVRIKGIGRSIFKTPKTDDGVKNSAMGRLAVFDGGDGDMVLINDATREQESLSLLQPSWRDGRFMYSERVTFDQVRGVAAKGLLLP